MTLSWGEVMIWQHRGQGAAQSVKLYVDPERFYYEFDHPAFGAAKQPPEVRARLIQKLEAIPDVTGLTYDYSDVLGLKRTQ